MRGASFVRGSHVDLPLRLRTLLLTGAIASLCAAAAAAQPEGRALRPGDVIDFAADSMEYDDEAKIVTARGNVVVARDGYRLTADEVAYNRETGTVEARGAIKIIDPSGNEAFAERVELTESLRDGAVDGFLLVLQDGGRLAATGGRRVEGRSELDRAVYSPCNVIGADGCPKDPLWQVKARRVRHDPGRSRIYYDDAWLEVLGFPIMYVPAMSHPDGPGRNASGLLVPSLRIDRSLGVSAELPYYLSFSQHNDLTLTPILYTEVNPALQAEYRHLTASGPIRIGGIGTYSSELDFPGSSPSAAGVAGKQLRGYIHANGQLLHGGDWRSTFGVRLTSDDTFLRRYDISRDDTLRNFYRLERLGSESYLSIEGWAFQGLRRTDVPGLTPIELPLVDYRWTPASAVVGGRVAVAVNSAAITRTDGMGTQRAAASVEWKRSGYTALGHRVTATALLRGDIYHVSDAALSELPIYAGRNGWQGRVLPAAAVDVEWPFAGPLLGGTQTLTPRVQFAVSPNDANDGIPNEDSRAVDLEDVNLFEINRFPGYDRWEGGARLTYGARWRLDRPRWLLESEFGQSYRFDRSDGLFPAGTGLSGNFSDFVGRNTVRFGRAVDFTHRFRLDKSSLKLRRNEIDVTVGGRRTYATVGYVKLDRDIGIEDLQDREEVRAGGRVSFARYWSVIGSVIVDLTSRAEDPLNTSDGFDVVRHRLGVAYQDECFEFGLTWRRDYVEDRDFRRGNTFLINLNFRNLGR
jgi:LPS-assembly protein